MSYLNIDQKPCELLVVGDYTYYFPFYSLVGEECGNARHPGNLSQASQKGLEDSQLQMQRLGQQLEQQQLLQKAVAALSDDPFSVLFRGGWVGGWGR